MPGKTIGKRLNLGYAGTITSIPNAIVTNKVAADKIEFGSPLVLNEDNTYSRFNETHTPKDFAGVAVRTVKQQTSIYQELGEYLKGEPTDGLNEGSITVYVQRGTPKARGTVYIRILENPTYPNCEIGNFEAEADGANTIELDDVIFATGQLDGNKIAEITLLKRFA